MTRAWVNTSVSPTTRTSPGRTGFRGPVACGCGAVAASDFIEPSGGHGRYSYSTPPTGRRRQAISSAWAHDRSRRAYREAAYLPPAGKNENGTFLDKVP